VKRLVMVLALIVPIVVSTSHSASAATYTGCSSWRTVNNPWTGLPITPGSNQRYANLNSLDLSCVDLNGVDFYGAVLGGVIWTNSNLTNTNFGGTGYCGGIFTGADIAGSNLQSTGTWSCAYRVDVYVNPVTTTIASTTIPPSTTTTSPPPTTTTTTTTTSLPPSPTTTVLQTTTTTTIAPNYYCLKIGGLGLTVRWLNSRDVNWGDSRYLVTPGPGVVVMTLSSWLGKTNQEKTLLSMSEVAVRPIPAGGCSTLDEQLTAVATTTTTTIPQNQNSSTSSSTTTSVPRAGSSSATTIPANRCSPTRDELFIYSYFDTGKVTNYVGTFDVSSIGYRYDYQRNCFVAPITKLLIETSYGVVTSTSRFVDIDFDKSKSNCWRVARVSDYGQSSWSNQVCYTAPIQGVKKTSGKSSVVPRGVTGAQCLDGYRTSVRTKKACSTHFGRDYWLFKKFKPGYVFSYKPKRSYTRFAVDTGSATGRCVGICYGVPSTVNGLPRNTYVSGYFRKDGTYVGPYTRSSR
jgi:hypothetical protein